MGVTQGLGPGLVCCEVSTYGFGSEDSQLQVPTGMNR